jgi:hypothetical protein
MQHDDGGATGLARADPRSLKTLSVDDYFAAFRG